MKIFPCIEESEWKDITVVRAYPLAESTRLACNEHIKHISQTHCRDDPWCHGFL